MDRSKEMEELINNLGNRLWTFCKRLTYEKYEAEDLYHDTMLKALELKDKIDFDNNPRAFIYSLAVSINNNRIRKLLRRKSIAPTYHYDLDIIKDNIDIELEIVENEKKKILDRSINNLNPKQKPVILLFYMEDLSIKEIANYLKIPEGTVKSRLNKGREILKKELEVIDYER